MTLRIATLVLVGLSCTSCAGSYYDRYAKDHPGWYATFPEEGAGLYRTLAGLYAPHPFHDRLSISKLAVLRVGGGQAVALDAGELDLALGALPGAEDYAIVATIDCVSAIDTKRYRAQSVGWMLLEGGRLSAWDVPIHVDRCVVGNEFRPASRESAALEDSVREFRDRSFPKSMSHPGELYGKGLAYLDVGRLQAAEEMLASGDAAFDVGSAGALRFERPSSQVDVMGARQVTLARDQLRAGVRAQRAPQAVGR